MSSSAALGMVNTVVFAYETIRKIQPKDVKNLKQLGNAYLEAGDSDMAIKTGNRYGNQPKRRDAEDLLKRDGRSGDEKGKWEESEDYGAQLKDESEAQP